MKIKITSLLIIGLCSVTANAQTYATFTGSPDTDSSSSPVYDFGTGVGAGSVGATYSFGTVGTTTIGGDIYARATITGLSDVEISTSGAFQDPEGRSRLGFGINGLGANPLLAFSFSFFSDAAYSSALSLANLTVTISDIDSDEGDDFSEYVGVNSSQVNGATTDLGSYLT